MMTYSQKLQKYGVIKKMRKRFKKLAAPPEQQIVIIPAHQATFVDHQSIYEDGMQGRLGGMSEAALNQRYTHTHWVAEQKFVFTSWDRVSIDMPKETRALLEKALAEKQRADQMNKPRNKKHDRRH